MDYLLYWKSFWSESGGRPPAKRDWYTDRKWLWEKAARGDRFWVVITAPKKAPGQWRLLERLEVAKPDSNVRRSGRKYRIVGSRKRSRVFDFAEGQGDVAPVLRRLDFSTGRRLTLAGSAIGRCIRNPRRLTPEDAQKLEDFASRL
jgi:hypothetical protein